MMKNNNITEIVNQNTLDSYSTTEKTNMQNGRVTFVQNDNDIINFVNKAKNAVTSNKMFFGKIGQEISNKIKNILGLDVSNYNVALSSYEIKHILNNHSDKKKEISRGQVPITVDDFKKIPQIISNPDSIYQDGTTFQGKAIIIFKKNIAGNNVIVSWVSDKHKNLDIHTMRKFKNNKK